jgi:hypothetical protein
MRAGYSQLMRLQEGRKPAHHILFVHRKILGALCLVLHEVAASMVDHSWRDGHCRNTTSERWSSYSHSFLLACWWNQQPLGYLASKKLVRSWSWLLHEVNELKEVLIDPILMWNKYTSLSITILFMSPPSSTYPQAFCPSWHEPILLYNSSDGYRYYPG